MMYANSIPVFLLTVLLLATAASGLRWQGTGSTNNTVIAKIWQHVETKINSSMFIASTQDLAFKTFCKTLSDQLNTLWDPAWNVAIYSSLPQYDTILYGYAFNNQWMWYNGVSNTAIPSPSIISIVVWKDYNCQKWSYIADADPTPSTFTLTQKNLIKAEITKITQTQLNNDVWGVAYTLMTSIQAKSEFSSGGYSIIMAQYSQGFLYGWACRKSDNFYHSYVEYGSTIIPSKSLGVFYLFQTR